MRIILILLVLGGLILLLAYNLSPVSLVFLGARTPALPLAVWILLSVVAGAFTSLLLAGLYRLSSYNATSRPQRDRKVETPPPSTQSRQYTTPNPPQPNTDSAAGDDFDDWDSDSTNDDWDFEEDTNDADADGEQDFSPQNQEIKDAKSYEVNKEPKSSSHSGSVYSYSYQEPKNSGVGKTESIYDADYRVLTPPYRQIDTPQQTNQPDEEDWGFEDDDDFFEEGDSDSSSKR